MKIRKIQALGLVGKEMKLDVDQLRALADMIVPVNDAYKRRETEYPKREEETDKRYAERVAKRAYFKSDEEMMAIKGMHSFIQTIIGDIKSSKEVMNSLFVDDDEEEQARKNELEQAAQETNETLEQ